MQSEHFSIRSIISIHLFCIYVYFVDETSSQLYRVSKRLSRLAWLVLRKAKRSYWILLSLGPCNIKICDQSQIWNNDSDWLIAGMLNNMRMQQWSWLATATLRLIANLNVTGPWALNLCHSNHKNGGKNDFTAFAAVTVAPKATSMTSSTLYQVG